MSFQRLAHWLQLDRSLSFALMARIWQAISGPITVALQIGAFNLHELGVFVGILSVVGIQPLFELGLASVLISQAGNTLGRKSARSATGQSLAWLSQGGVRWFSGVAGLYAVAGLWVGWKVLSGSEVGQIDWRMPLVLTIGVSAFSLAISPRVYVLEGAGEREFVYRMRFFQAVLGSLTMWCGLWFGFKLWAIVAVFVVGAVFHAMIAFGPRARRLLAPAAGQTPAAGETLAVGPRTSWLSHIGPLQWRMAAIAAAHYLASQLLYLYVLNYHPAEQAAPLGMTLQVAVAVQSLALAWAQTKFPLISQHQTAGLREAAGTLWRQTALVSTGLLVLGMIGLAVGVLGLGWLDRGWEKRFVSAPLILTLGAGYVANHWLALQSFYVLSRGAKPLVVASLVGLLLTAAAVWWGGKEFSVAGVIIAYSLSMACVTLPLHTWAYFKFRAQ